MKLQDNITAAIRIPQKRGLKENREGKRNTGNYHHQFFGFSFYQYR